MPRLPRPRQVVILTREEHDLRRLPEVPQRPEPLLALLDRHAIVVIRMQDEDRRRHVLHVLERRAFPVEIVLLEDVSPEVALMPVRAVTRAIVADEIRD